tara:strand:+ start:136 stop:720 length:585 start_codon:yes stop_codon:yes gene_type:complete
MSKGRHRARERQARKYFPGGTMPDGLELFPLDGGKLEIVQELFTASEDEAIDDDDLGHGITKLYASRYDDVKDLDILEIVEQGKELFLRATLEDRQATEEVILADFDALQASIARSPKTIARRKEGSDHSDTPLISGPDFPSDTQDTTLTPSPASKSSRSSSQKDTRTDKKEIPSSGPTATVSRSKQPASVSSA